MYVSVRDMLDSIELMKVLNEFEPEKVESAINYNKELFNQNMKEIEKYWSKINKT